MTALSSGNIYSAKINFISIINFLSSGRGHVLNYHTAVAEAVRSLGWRFMGFYSKHETIKVSDDWWPIINCRALEKIYSGNYLQRSKFVRRLSAIHATFKYALSLHKALSKILNTKMEKNILFCEVFVPAHLIAIFIALLLLPKKNLQFWLLYRQRPDSYGKVKHYYKWLNIAFSKLLANGHFRLLTDSELLAISIFEFYRQPVSVVPIPHTIHIPKPFIRKLINPDIVYCWWCGEPRLTKGWDLIRQLCARKSTYAKYIHLIAAESANLKSSNGCVTIETVKDILSHEEYYHTMEQVQALLLPYDPILYSEATSGVFVEGIAMGVMPIANAGTWMAYELGKYDLNELIVNWEKSDIWETIIKAIGSEEIKRKMGIMQQEYISFHCAQNYSYIISRLEKAA